ncbi:hypothetical protein F4818DRAFT_457655 [Hypoxylon cercidicola]|nr:hypothetical protein F4818DRAFT_457655 [Hypoxylon cercidicola]
MTTIGKAAAAKYGTDDLERSCRGGSTKRREAREELEERKKIEAARKIWQIYRDIVARRKAAGTLGRRDFTGKGKKSIAESVRKPTDTSSQHVADKPGDPNRNTDRKPVRSEPDVYYELIGECYVDGMMNGEALMRSHQSMLFEIR